MRVNREVAVDLSIMVGMALGTMIVTQALLLSIPEHSSAESGSSAPAEVDRDVADIAP